MTAQQLDVKTGLYIGGEWLGPEGRDTQAVLNPATGQSLGELPLATAADMDRALEAAARGFEQWRKTAPQERAAVLHRTAALVRERAQPRYDAAFLGLRIVVSDPDLEQVAENVERIGLRRRAREESEKLLGDLRMLRIEVQVRDEEGRHAVPCVPATRRP